MDYYYVYLSYNIFSCNTNSKAPDPIKIAVAGGDSYFNLVLRPYVEQFSAKSHDWQNYIKFLFIPLGTFKNFQGLDKQMQVCCNS